ncbi:MAG: CBO0543 family protein [Ignavibacteriales bacterium]
MLGNPETAKALEHAYRLITEANHEMIRIWVRDTLFGWEWWLGFVLAIVPWVLWKIFKKQESTNRLLYAGMFVVIITSWLDIIGVLFGLWSYYHNVVPFSPAFVPWDFTLFPVTVMFLLQWKPDIPPIYKAIGFSIFGAFISEPIFAWLGMYNPKNWEYYYSFPILVCIYLVADWLSKRSDFEKLT